MCRFIETIRIKDGVAENLQLHNRRMNDTRKYLFLQHHDCIRQKDSSLLEDSQFKDLCLEDYISPSEYHELTRCRVVYSDKIEKVEYFPYTIREIKSLRLVEDDDVEYTFKSEDRTVLDRNFAKRGDTDDVVIVRNGLLTDTSIANIALCRDGVWYTPRTPLLKGTRREALLSRGMLVEKDIPVSGIYEYTKIRLFNAMIFFGEIELNINTIY